MILEFSTSMEAQEFMDHLDSIAFPEMGYDHWDEIKESTEGTFYISSPRNDPRFSGWEIEGLYTEREMPEEWIEENA